MSFTEILSTWRDTFKVFRGFNAIFSKSIRASIEALKLLIKHFWWFFLLRFFLGSIEAFRFNKAVPGRLSYVTPYTLYHFMVLVLLGFLSFISYYIIILALRPTTKKKNFQYFLSYTKYIPGLFITGILFILFVLVPFALLGITSGAAAFMLGAHKGIGVIYIVLIWIAVMVLTVASLLMSLFYLDSKARQGDILKALRLGIKTSMHFFPVFVLIGLATGALMFIMYIPIAFAAGLLKFMTDARVPLYPLFIVIFSIAAVVIGYILSLLPLAVFINYYTKIKNTYSKLLR